MVDIIDEQTGEVELQGNTLSEAVRLMSNLLHPTKTYLFIDSQTGRVLEKTKRKYIYCLKGMDSAISKYEYELKLKHPDL